ncbi:MAG: hypothetical protein J6S14_12735 [Clostridia bacterium]|nr:hypothetical protein [Clostridia bacterium]
MNQYYGSAQAGLDENRRLAQEKNNVAYQTAQKYLPIQTKMNGLSGLGVGQSASVDLYNKYATRQGAIDASHASESNDLFKNYMTDRNAVETQQRAEQDALYNQALEIISGGYYTDWGDLENYLVNDVWGKVRPEQQNYLQQMYDYEMSNPTTIQLKEEERVARETINANNEMAKENEQFKISRDAKVEIPNMFERSRNPGEDIRIEIGNKKYSNFDIAGVSTEIEKQLIQTAPADLPNNQLFAFGGKVYIKKDGRFFEVTDGGSTTSPAYQSLLNNFYSKN